jgi:hypothetical protein
MMHVSIELLQAEGGTHTVKEVSDLLNVHFQELKRTNPLGFMDQFESQIESLACDVARQLGAEFDLMDTEKGLLFFYDWSRTGGSIVRQRIEALQTACSGV